MNELIERVRQLEKTEINDLITRRLSEFESFKNKSEDEWFSELCFCILTANAKQKTGAAIQEQIQAHGFKTLSQETLANLIKVNKHRFHNNKAKYIVKAREFANIKSIVSNKTELEARDFLVENISGLGMKEASHFLRNTGGQNLAILDRHILALLAEYKIIDKPKKLNEQVYRNIETKFTELASTLRMSLAKLDLFLWYMKTGEVLK
ncbi:N-glycosylase/DNA lyase [Candidatus Pacearchaeota archaeon]|nr:N-glycosylase/DNA lyase [Candidatus Pacearchaeota archaeon]